MSDVRIILFRGMNTGGVRAPVAGQTAMALDLGLAMPRTVLASGNLIVDSDADPAELEARVESETERRFGRRIETIVRSADQWSALMAANPFADEARKDPSRLLLMVMKAGIRHEGVQTLRAHATRAEAVTAAGGGLWFWHPDGIGQSKLAEKAQPRLIGSGTARNWNTVLKIAASAGLGETR